MEHLKRQLGIPPYVNKIEIVFDPEVKDLDVEIEAGLYKNENK